MRIHVRTALTIARRELSAYFASPIAYLVAAAFLVISGYLFAIILLNSRQATLDGMFFNINVILLFVAPLLTMRLLADEQHSGTIEWESAPGHTVFTILLPLEMTRPLHRE